MKPSILYDFIKYGGWVMTRNEKMSLFDGTCHGIYKDEIIDKKLHYIILDILDLDSGNFDFGEKFYRYNKDWYINYTDYTTFGYFEKEFENKKDSRKYLTEKITYCISENNLKDKYKNLIRKIKIERVLIT